MYIGIWIWVGHVIKSHKARSAHDKRWQGNIGQFYIGYISYSIVNIYSSNKESCRLNFFTEWELRIL